MKIYIIGCVGSGKTTLAKKMSLKYNIEHYELDLLVYDDLNGHVKRSDHEINELFDDILKKESFIIEDVGRNKFIKGREVSDIIYYIKLPKVVIFKRVIMRWIKQRLNLEEYNYPPTFNQLIDILKITWLYFKKEKEKIRALDPYLDKVIFLNSKNLREFDWS